MEEKETGKEVESLLANTIKEIQKERRRVTFWILLGGSLIIGTVLAIVLCYDHKQPIHFSPMPPVAEEKCSSESRQADLAAPSVAEFQSIESASMPNLTEMASIPTQELDTPALSAQEPYKPEAAVAKPKKAKSKLANKRRHVQRKTYYVTDFPDRRNYHYGFPAVSP